MRRRYGFLLACVLYSEYPQLRLVEAYAAQHKSVAAEGFDGVDAHAAHHLLNFVRPGVDEVYKALLADIGIEPFYKVGALCGNTPVALARMAAAAEMATERKHGGRCYVCLLYTSDAADD